MTRLGLLDWEYWELYTEHVWDGWFGMGSFFSVLFSLFSLLTFVLFFTHCRLFLSIFMWDGILQLGGYTQQAHCLVF
jgi:hypothetical protein